jgi:hypothetical protein
VIRDIVTFTAAMCAVVIATLAVIHHLYPL